LPPPWPRATRPGRGLNKALAEAMADGSYAQLSKKYFNEDVRCQ
jgi:hypothetical protein